MPPHCRCGCALPSFFPFSFTGRGASRGGGCGAGVRVDLVPGTTQVSARGLLPAKRAFSQRKRSCPTPPLSPNAGGLRQFAYPLDHLASCPLSHPFASTSPSGAIGLHRLPTHSHPTQRPPYLCHHPPKESKSVISCLHRLPCSLFLLFSILSLPLPSSPRAHPVSFRLCVRASRCTLLPLPPPPCHKQSSLDTHRALHVCAFIPSRRASLCVTST